MNDPKPGDRPLPTEPALDENGNLRDLDKEREARLNIIRHDPSDDQNKSDDGPADPPSSEPAV